MLQPAVDLAVRMAFNLQKEGGQKYLHGMTIQKSVFHTRFILAYVFKKSRKNLLLVINLFKLYILPTAFFPFIMVFFAIKII